MLLGTSIAASARRAAVTVTSDSSVPELDVGLGALAVVVAVESGVCTAAFWTWLKAGAAAMSKPAHQKRPALRGALILLGILVPPVFMLAGHSQSHCSLALGAHGIIRISQILSSDSERFAGTSLPLRQCNIH